MVWGLLSAVGAPASIQELRNVAAENPDCAPNVFFVKKLIHFGLRL